MSEERKIDKSVKLLIEDIDDLKKVKIYILNLRHKEKNWFIHWG
jgi:hypothetical protein